MKEPPADAPTLAERKMGELLKKMPKAAGGQPYQATSRDDRPVGEKPPTLKEIGITKKQSQGRTEWPPKMGRPFFVPQKADRLYERLHL